jgi:small-conductance mechanosensitive channel
LLSHGKRVLVTSQGERALRVLGKMISDKLKEIKPLCVSVLGSDKDSADELEQAVKQISEKLSSLDKVTLQREIHSLNQRLSRIREEIARKKNQIKHMAEREQETFEIAGHDLTPLEVSRWIGEHHEHSWLPDRLSAYCQTPFSDEEAARLFYLQGSLRREDLKELALKRPSLELLPTTLDFENLISALADAEKELTHLQDEESAWVEIRKELALKRPDSAKLPVLTSSSTVKGLIV